MYQFYHFDTYPINTTKSSKAFGQVSKEFMRHPSAVPHIESPQPPILRFGVDAYQAEQIIQARIKKAKDARGRKIRKDAQVCISSVVSFPRELEQQFPEFYEDWVQRNINYFRRQYGENLLSVIEHQDESHPHLHMIIGMPDTTEPGKAALKNIHSPYMKRDSLEGSKTMKNTAYNEACRKMQDDYYSRVSVHHGLLRTGPKRKRLTRKEYVTAKREAFLLAQSLRENESLKLNLTKKAERIEIKQRKLSTLESSVKSNAKYIINQKEGLRKREAVIFEKEENIETQEKSLLTFLDLKFEPNKSKNFYSKTVKNLKVKLNEYIRLFEEYREKYNKLTVKHTNLEQIYTENKIENVRLKNENRKLRVALQIYKKSDSIVSNDMEYTP
ncbi:plasmid recombination protein [Vibrio alginolyticus]|uniref:plasmid recombination protein n=1 Tax=Vibrio alginolyticus TaxID=663 RepID=UPI00215CEB48|nr:plasmid recombination protein [Vibrio alginolyticus]ELB2280588.1 plasmid recombination protein [Vibrio alginolyticus]MCS0001584.1 plasmid recombination protein [Vibrio alginolyticus]